MNNIAKLNILEAIKTISYINKSQPRTIYYYLSIFLEIIRYITDKKIRNIK